MRQSESGASIATQLNTAFASNATLQSAGLVADFGVTAAGKLTVSSNNGTFFRVDSVGASTAAKVIGSAVLNTAATAGQIGGTTAGPYAITGANDTLKVTVDGGSAQTITLIHGGARTAAQVVTDVALPS